MPKEFAKLTRQKLVKITKLGKDNPANETEKQSIADTSQQTNSINQLTTSQEKLTTPVASPKAPSPRRFNSSSSLSSSSGSSSSILASTSSTLSLYHQINQDLSDEDEPDSQLQKQASPSVSFNIKGETLPKHPNDEKNIADMLHERARSEEKEPKIRPITFAYQGILGNTFDEPAIPPQSEVDDRETYTLSEMLKMPPDKALLEDDDELSLLEILRSPPEIVRTEREPNNAAKSPSQTRRRRNSILGLQSLRREKETDNNSTKSITLTLGSAAKTQHANEMVKLIDLWRPDKQLQELLTLDGNCVVADGKTALELKVASSPKLIDKIREEMTLILGKASPVSPHEKPIPKKKDNQISKSLHNQAEITTEKHQANLPLLFLRSLKIKIEIFTQLIDLINSIERNTKIVEHLDPLSRTYAQTVMTLEHDIKEACRILMSYEEINKELTTVINDKSLKNENDLAVQVKSIAQKLSYEQVDAYCKLKTGSSFAALKTKLPAQEQQLNSPRSAFAAKIEAYEKQLQAQRNIPRPAKKSSVSYAHSRAERQQMKPFSYHWEGVAAQQIAAQRKKSLVQLIVLDVDDTLLILETLSRLKNGHLIIPVLQFATALGIPIGIATSRNFDLDYGAHQGLGTINEMLQLLTSYQIGFGLGDPDLIIDKDVENEYNSKGNYKNFCLELIRKRYQTATQAETPIDEIRTVLVDDNENNIVAAYEAGYRTITVPDNNIDYILELARDIGLDKYLSSVKFCSKSHKDDPIELAAIAKRYEAALANHQHLKSVPIYVNQDVPHLFNLIRVDQAKATQIIKSNCENRLNFDHTLNKFLNEHGQTLLGYALERNAIEVLTALLNAGANPLTEFSFNQKETLPIIAAIQLHSSLDIINLLLQHGAMDLIPKSFSILNAVLDETNHPNYANMAKQILNQIVKRDGTNALINLLNKAYESGPYVGHSLFTKAIANQNETFLNIVFNLLSEQAKSKLVITPAVETNLKILRKVSANQFGYFIHAQLVDQLRDITDINFLKSFVSKVKNREDNSEALLEISRTMPELKDMLSLLSSFAMVISHRLANNTDASKFIIYFAYAKERLLQKLEQTEFVDIVQRLLTLTQALETSHPDVTNTVMPSLQTFLKYVRTAPPATLGLTCSNTPLTFFAHTSLEVTPTKDMLSITLS